MNEHIRGLAEQAADYANTYSDAGADVWFEIYNKKFAQLIVRECIDWCNAHARDDGTAQRIAEDIKKDFGVEE